MKGGPKNMSTATTNSTPLPTLADLLAARKKLLGPPDTDWMLLSPDGRIWKGDVCKLFAVLAQQHTLLKPGGFL